jgi:hypothetical protein
MSEVDDPNLSNTPSPQDAAPPPAGGQPGDANPDASALQQLNQDMEGDPEVAKGALGAVGDMMDRYMDEDDPSWTPGDDDSKQAVADARESVRRAHESMSRVRK